MEAYAGRAAMEAEARRQHEEGQKTDLFKLMHKHEKPRLTSGVWERALDHGDHLAEKLIERAIEALGTGIASACNLLDPEAVILGGGLGVRFGERFMEPLTKEMGKHLFVDERPPAVRVAARGDRGGAIGASQRFSRERPIDQAGRWRDGSRVAELLGTPGRRRIRAGQAASS